MAERGDDPERFVERGGGFGSDVGVCRASSSDTHIGCVYMP